MFYQLNFQFRFLKHLILDSITFDKFIDFVRILQSVSNLQYITALTLRNCGWTTYDNATLSEQKKGKQQHLVTHNICDIIRRTPLTTLVVSNNNYLKLPLIFKAVGQRKSVEHLDISGNVLNSHDIGKLLEALKDCSPPLNKLSLANIRVNNTHLIAKLLNQLLLSHNVQDVDLSGVTLRNCSTFTQSTTPTRNKILTLPTIKYEWLVRLICDNCSLTDHNVLSIGLLLQQLINIREVSLLGNRFGTTKKYALELLDTCFVSHNPMIARRLKDLSFTCCYFDTQVIDMLTQKAGKCVNLKRLYIVTMPCPDLICDLSVGHLNSVLHKSNKKLSKFSLTMCEEPFGIGYYKEHLSHWKRL